MPDSFDRSLAHVLRNWAEKQHPPLWARARLLQTAMSYKPQRKSWLQFSAPRRSEVRVTNLSSLFYAPQMSYVGAWINF